jgi:hypothetical protein
MVAYISFTTLAYLQNVQFLSFLRWQIVQLFKKQKKIPSPIVTPYTQFGPIQFTQS